MAAALLERESKAIQYPADGKLKGNWKTGEKIYNAQAFVPCSRMPRLGHNGILTPEKIAHITAFLLSPESPVNK